MICQRLDTYNGPQVLYSFFLSDNQLFEICPLFLEVLTQAHNDQNRLGSSKYHFQSLWYDSNSNLRATHPDPGVLYFTENRNKIPNKITQPFIFMMKRKSAILKSVKDNNR